MGKRDQIIQELDKGLAHLEEQERTLTGRSAGLLVVTTAAVAVVISLRQQHITPPVALIVMYILLAIVSTISISGRRLVNPSLNQNVREQWLHLSDDEVYEVLFDLKRLAMRANSERMVFVRLAFVAHMYLVAATLVTSLVLLWRYT